MSKLNPQGHSLQRRKDWPHPIVPPPLALLSEDREELQTVFTYHKPKDDKQIENYHVLRSAAHYFASVIAATVPLSPERNVALGKVREAVMWANAGLACRSPE